MNKSIDPAAAEHAWHQLAERLVASESDVELGRMMSAEAVTCRGKVFAFRSTKTGTAGMGFRLGRDYDFATLPTDQWAHLAPFKTKPPMKDWIIVPDAQAEHWPMLAKSALEIMRGKLYGPR